MRPRFDGARIALLLALFSLIPGTPAAERTGTPRMGSGTYSNDRGPDFYPWPEPVPVNTLVLGAWTFGTSPSCTADGWTSVDLTAGELNFGDYAGLLTGRDQYVSDQCLDNLGCLWGFHNGSDDVYACGGRASQPVVPYGSAQNGYIWNEIQSPLMSLSGTGSVFGLRFTVYRDLRFSNLVFYTCRVRSWHAGSPGEWKGNGALYYGPTVARGDWLIQDEQIGALVEPGADQIQVALGVVDMAGVWGGLLGNGACHTNAPYFDSVKVFRAASNGPQWSVDVADLFQDNFADDGTVTGTVRMDMARDINPRDVPSIHPGDSVVVTVSEPTVGLGFHASAAPASGPAVYLHVHDVTPAKSGAAISGDPLRWPVVSTGGGWTTLRCDSVRSASGPVRDRYCVDLNDDLYTPGDTVLFFFSARDAAGRTTYWTEFNGTRTGPPDHRLSMEATCLPTSRNGLGILYVDDTDGSGGQNFFDGAFLTLGITEEVDRYDVRGWYELAGNGPGSRVRNADAQLAAYYDTIIWSSGIGTAGTVGDGSGMPEKSPDAAMLVEFIEHKVTGGLLYLCGDHIAAELKELTSPSAQELLSYIQYDLVAETHQLVGAISPRVTSTPQSAFTRNGVADTFNLFGGCAHLNSFCLLAPSGPSIAETMYGTSDQTPYAAEVSQLTNERWVILSGFGFEFMRDDELDGVSDRAKHLHDMLESRELPVTCSAAAHRIEPDDKGARITWKATNCGRFIRIIRTADWAGTNEVIHTAALPPSTGTFHDPIPYGGTAYYRLEEVGVFGRVVAIETATITRSVARTNFQVRANGPWIEVSWSIEDRSGIESLVVERRENGADAFVPVSADMLPPPSSRFVDTGFIPGTRYEYRLAMHYGAHTTYSNAVNVNAPHALTLGQNAPNPFNPSTRIPFLMPSPGELNVMIFNVSGQHVRTLWDGMKNAGYAELEWDGRSDTGAPVASGIYFCRLTALGQSLTRKIVLIQ